jgi:hypothetical protein
LLAILLLASGLSVREGIASERAALRNACEALSGLVIPAGKIGLPTSGARVESGRLEAATTQGNLNGSTLAQVHGGEKPALRWMRRVILRALQISQEADLLAAGRHAGISMSPFRTTMRM